MPVDTPEIVVPGPTSKAGVNPDRLPHSKKPEAENAAELREELAAIEAKFEELRPKLTQEAKAWRRSHPEIDKWNQRTSELSNWQLSEGKAAARALQDWMDEDNGSHRDERKQRLAQARQKTVVSQLREFLANPDSAASTRAYLEKYVAETQPPVDELEHYWNTTITSLPPRSLIKEILSGVDVEAELPDEPRVPEGVMDYARLEFDNGFQVRLILRWVEASKPESLRKIMATWKDLNERRFAILEALGVDTKSVSSY